MHAAPPPAAALANTNIKERRLGSVINSGHPGKRQTYKNRIYPTLQN